jgi:hypothetical protein
VVVLGTVAGQEKYRRRGDALGEDVEDGLRFEIHPVKVLNNETEPFGLARRQ